MKEERNEIFRKVKTSVSVRHGLFQVGEISMYVTNPSYKRKKISLEEFREKFETQYYATHGNVFYAPKEEILWFIDRDSPEIYTLKLPS